MKLCKDCEHFAPFVERFLFFKRVGPLHLSKCRAFPDPVTGEAGRFCDIERAGGGPCGQDGKLWKPAHYVRVENRSRGDGEMPK